MAEVVGSTRHAHRWWAAPAFAHPRILGRLPGGIAIAASIAALALIADESGVSERTRTLAIALAVSTALLGAVLITVANQLPTWTSHALTVISSGVVTAYVVLYADTPTGPQFIWHYFFTVTLTAFYFSWGEAIIQGTLVLGAAVATMAYAGLSAVAILNVAVVMVAVGIAVAKMAQIADRGDHDTLTDLPTTRAMLTALDEAFYAARDAREPLALVIVGVDRLTEYNDRHGYNEGNKVLATCAALWRNLVPDVRMLSRFTGDEFALILPRHQVEEAAEIAERLRLNANSQITVSVGVAGLTTNDSPSMLINRTVAALHHAKSGGGDQVAIDNDSTIAHELEDAIDNGELFMVYQPVVRLATGEVVSREALVRWQHPVRGLISPTDFIPDAERSGVIHRLGAWTLNEACSVTAKTDTGTHVAVNVSVCELRSPQYVGVVAEALRRTGLSARRLVIEVTEGVSDQFDEQVVATLKALRELGIRIAIDDFGSGYSSLRWVADFPVDILKVDGTFVQNIDEDAERAPILEAIVFMGWSLGLAVIAEHVESEYQAKRLRKLGCDYAQGYLFGHPEPLAAGQPVPTLTPGEASA